MPFPPTRPEVCCDLQHCVVLNDYPLTTKDIERQIPFFSIKIIPIRSQRSTTHRRSIQSMRKEFYKKTFVEVITKRRNCCPICKDDTSVWLWKKSGLTCNRESGRKKLSKKPVKRKGKMRKPKNASARDGACTIDGMFMGVGLFLHGTVIAADSADRGGVQGALGGRREHRGRVEELVPGENDRAQVQLVQVDQSHAHEEFLLHPADVAPHTHLQGHGDAVDVVLLLKDQRVLVAGIEGADGRGRFLFSDDAFVFHQVDLHIGRYNIIRKHTVDFLPNQKKTRTNNENNECLKKWVKNTDTIVIYWS